MGLSLRKKLFPTGIQGENGIAVGGHVNLPLYFAYANLAIDDSGTNSAQVYRKISRDVHLRLPKPFHLDKPEYTVRTSISHLHDRMPNWVDDSLHVANCQANILMTPLLTPKTSRSPTCSRRIL